MSEGQYNPDSIDAVLSRIDSTLKKHVDDTALYRQALDKKLAEHAAEISANAESISKVSTDLSEHKTRVLTFATLIGGASGHIGGWFQKIFGQ